MTSATALPKWQEITDWNQTLQFRNYPVAIKTENSTWKTFSKYTVSDGVNDIFFGTVSPALVKIWREGRPISDLERLVTAIAQPTLSKEGKPVFMRLATVDEVSKIDEQRPKLCLCPLGGVQFTYEPTANGLRQKVHVPHYD